MPSPKFYTVSEVAERLQIHRNTLQRYLREGQMGSIRVGQGARAPYRITDRHIEDYIKRN